jgi:hypothetical protein
VDVQAVIELSVAASRVYAELEDLGSYPRWLSIVGKADPVGPGPAWLVDLSTGVGPLRLRKRLRMVRVGAEPPRALRFERAELDERSHSPWILNATIEPTSAVTSLLTMQLHYGGATRLPFVVLALGEEIRRAGPRLQRLVDGPEPAAR